MELKIDISFRSYNILIFFYFSDITAMKKACVEGSIVHQIGIERTFTKMEFGGLASNHH